MADAERFIDDAGNIKKAQEDREEALIIQSAEVVKRAKVEADKFMCDAQNWLKSAEEHIAKKEEKLKKQAGESEKLRLFLNNVADGLKAVFRALPDAVIFALPTKLHEQLMRFFKITPIEKPLVEPAQPIEAPAPSPEPKKVATGLLSTLSRPAPKPGKDPKTQI